VGQGGAIPDAEVLPVELDADAEAFLHVLQELPNLFHVLNFRKHELF
jgi:hypothetical protein